MVYITFMCWDVYGEQKNEKYIEIILTMAVKGPNIPLIPLIALLLFTWDLG